MGQEELGELPLPDATENKNPIPETLIHPPAHLPQPEPPPGLTRSTSTGPSPSPSLSLTNFLKTRISSLTDPSNAVTSIHLSGLKVTVKPKTEDEDAVNGGYNDVKGRISFFSRSGCRDSAAVRSFLRSKKLPFVEINLDVFREREKELIERSSGIAVPAVFFNEGFVGGLEEVNGMRKRGEFEGRVREMAGRRCPESAPRVPVYGFDEEGEEREDGMVGVVRVLRQRLPMEDRIVRMKIVRNCFAGAELVEGVRGLLDCGRHKV